MSNSLKTVTIILQDTEGGSIDVNARIEPLPSPEELNTSPAICLLHDFIAQLELRIESASARYTNPLTGEVFHEQNLMEDADENLESES